MTISEKQLIANRNNCLKSTGPRTLEGKKNASRNAVRHGLLSDSTEVLLKGENQDEFEAFHQNLLINLDPQGQLEVLLAERITGFFWKLKRAGRMEKGLLDILCSPSSDSDPSSKKSSLPFVMIMTKTYEKPADDPEYQEFKKLKEQQTAASGLDVSEGKIIDKESYDSIRALQAPEKKPSSDTDSSSAESLGKAIQHDFKSGSLLERLLRYEGQIERSLYRALTELQKMQFIRKRNEAIDADNAADLSLPKGEASRFEDSRCHPREACPVGMGGGDPDSSLGPGLSSEPEKPNEAILTSQDHPEPGEGSDSITPPPSLVVSSVEPAVTKVAQASCCGDSQCHPREDGDPVSSSMVSEISQSSIDNCNSSNPNTSVSQQQRTDLAYLVMLESRAEQSAFQENSGNIQSATCPQGIDNLSHRDLQSTESVKSVVSKSSEPKNQTKPFLTKT